MPVALISLVDDRRQFLKSQVGCHRLGAKCRSKSRTASTSIATQRPLIVADARQDPRLSDLAATREWGIVAYAAIPLTTADGYMLGSLCVIDRQPRQWTDDEISLLSEFAHSVLTEIELRRTIHDHERAVAALYKSGQEMEAVLANVPLIIASFDCDGIITMTQGKELEALGAQPNRVGWTVDLCRIRRPARTARGRRAHPHHGGYVQLLFKSLTRMATYTTKSICRRSSTPTTS